MSSTSPDNRACAAAESTEPSECVAAEQKGGQYAHLCDLHRRQALRYGPRPALRFKQDGLYRVVDWTTYRRQADSAAAGWAELGVQPGDRVAMFSPNRVEWLIADHSILSAAAVTVPLHAPLSAKQAAYQLSHSEACGIWICGREQADKLRQVASELPRLRFVVTCDADFATDDFPWPVFTWAGLIQRGRQRLAERPQIVAERESGVTAQTTATIIYTSGTTGNPKGVMLSHGNLLSNAIATGRISYLQPGDELLSWLPYSHIYARTVDHYLTTFQGLIVALAESVDTLVQNLAEVRPTWLTAVPRFYEKLWAVVESLPDDARTAALTELLGGRIRQLTSGGAPLPKQIAEGFFAAGIPLLEGYGLTESSPVIAFNSIEQYRIGSVGKPLPGVEVKIADDGEILTRGPHVMQGYWRNEAATNEAIRDGWLHTGDVGTLDADGFLTITDRKKDLFVTSAGKNVAPAILEHLLTSDPLIDQAVVYGDGRPFISAIVVPNFANVCRALARDAFPAADPDGFVRESAVVQLLQARIDELMQSVSRPERVKKFLVLGRPFDAEGDELTATLKVRRRHIVAKFEPQLLALYEQD